MATARWTFPSVFVCALFVYALFVGLPRGFSRGNDWQSPGAAMPASGYAPSAAAEASPVAQTPLMTKVLLP